MNKENVLIFQENVLKKYFMNIFLSIGRELLRENKNE